MARNEGRAILAWVAGVETVGLLLAIVGWSLSLPGLLWSGLAVLLAATLAFGPLVALSRLGSGRDRGGADRDGPS